MLTLSFRFPASRFHATPWGSHVNEGLVEWPPSPWRVLRAFIAVGFTRLGWATIPTVARSLIEKLAAASPEICLPPASAGHTRHYMPLFKEKTTKVIDAFAYVGDGELVIVWPADLSHEERELAAELAEAMPYLGRAESAVECRIIAEPPSNAERCVASDSCPAPGFERVTLLAPESAQAYEAWRRSAVARATDSALAAAVDRASEAGKKAPSTLSKKDVERINSSFPRDIIAALTVETNWLRSIGWSQPPGSRWVSYWRSRDALRVAPAPQALRRNGEPPTTALLALSSDTKNGEALPPVRDALWRLEAIHEALVHVSARLGDVPAVFTGKSGDEPMRGHKHATLLPLTLDSRADRIDHVLIHAPMGLDEAALAAVHGVRRTWAKNLPTIYVTVAGVGGLSDFAPTVRELSEARSWSSRTPYVAPRFAKAHGRNTLEGQIREELSDRGFPEPLRILVDACAPEFRWFRRERRDPRRAPPSSAGHSVTIEFSESVAGPITLGYASHFGLGVFAPNDEAAR